MLKKFLFVTLLLPVFYLPAQDVAPQPARQGPLPEQDFSRKTSGPPGKGFSGHALGLSIGIEGVWGDSIPFTIPAGFSWRLAWQNALDQKQRLRLSASLAMADMMRREYTLPNYSRRVLVSARSTALQVGLHYDLFKWGGFSIVTAGNVALRYLRGMSIPQPISNGADVTNLNEWYPTAGFSFSFRLAPRRSPLAYEFNLYSAGYARDQTYFERLSFGLVYRFRKRGSKEGN
ncbi:MAG: hypothetical protein RI565_03035 [Schleiferiaceae bacterium]|nr:hypothetical protein [Schleiferiaceae bacterium]